MPGFVTYPRKPHRTERGSSLAIALVLISITSLSLLWLGQSMLAHDKLNKRQYELSRAFYGAEAGVQLVIHWGNFPEDFTKNPLMFTRADPPEDESTTETLINITNNPEELFPVLAGELAGGSYTLTQGDLAAMDFGELQSEHGYGVSSIKEIELIASEASDPVPCFFKVRSVGESPDGIEREVVAYMNISPIFAIQVPAGLISYNVAAAFGNARVHWGESWSKNNFDMLAASQMDYLRPIDPDYDPHAIYRTEGQIQFPSSWKWGLGKDLYDASSPQPGALPASGQFADAFHQFVPNGTLSWPDFQYQTFKDMALEHGRYYSTDASGNLYRNGVETEANKVDFLTEFGVADRENAPYDLVFIDTVDGNAPAADGSNLATISTSGNSLGLKGVFWIGANFDGAGVGSPPSLNAEDPDEVLRPLDKIFVDGVLYSAGHLELGGNAGVYGSVITDRGFTGGGTPDVYYNHNLANGLELTNGNLGSIFRVNLNSI